MSELLNYFTARTDEMLALLQQMVEIESPSREKAAVDWLGAFIAAKLRQLGADVEVVPQQEVGDHLLARWGRGEGGLLLMAHMDTVHDLGTITRRPLRVEDGKFYGPGAFDMKASIVMAIFAMRALQELGQVPNQPLTFLVSSDEETGSATSRTLIESEARKSRAVLCLEPSLPPHGAIKTFRKGTGVFQIRITGRAAHAGADPEKGVSAVQELAHQILALHAMNDFEIGTTVNVGVVEGGSRVNVVADSARAVVDLRVPSKAEGARMEEAIRSLKPVLPGTQIQVSGGLSRPPMERTPQIVALYQRARELGKQLGLDLAEGGTGGASDGNLTAALGVPTLDGLGAVGDRAHSPEEHIVIKHLSERAALLALLIEEGGV